MTLTHRFFALLIAFLAALAPLAASAGCPPGAWPVERLQSLKRDQWRLADERERADLAGGLLACLRSPDPVLRDELAYEALQAWLRSNALGPARAQAIGDAMLLAMRSPDPSGVGQPFAALVLAEVVRADRLQPLWTPPERQAVLDAAVQWVRGIRDHRGFEPGIGWRHAVAHGADLLLQFALNPQLDKAQLDALLDAVASQVLPAGGVSYVHGESERLARPLFFVARRGLHDEAAWTAWFQRLVTASAPPAGASASRDTLARTHNLKAFVYPLYATIMEGQDAALRERLRPGLLAALRALR